jgi:FKBP-type peptidyl-prolyl cis-trans isomerase
MRKMSVCLTALALTLGGVACEGEMSGGGTAKAELKGEKEKFSYALGMEIGESFKQMTVDVDMASFMQGVKDARNENELLLSQEDAQAVKAEMFGTMRQEQQAALTKQAGENKVESDAFLDTNAERDEVTTTESGLQYEVLTKGSGPKPTASDKVKVHYTGKLLDGTVFDSSRERGEPVVFPVKAVIPGWSEALQLMNVGSTYKLYIPPKLAYGERGAGGGKVPPNATLVFEVELLSIEE